MIRIALPWHRVRKPSVPSKLRRRLRLVYEHEVIQEFQRLPNSPSINIPLQVPRSQLSSPRGHQSLIFSPLVRFYSDQEICPRKLPVGGNFRFWISEFEGCAQALKWLFLHEASVRDLLLVWLEYQVGNEVVFWGGTGAVTTSRGELWIAFSDTSFNPQECSPQSLPLCASVPPSLNHLQLRN